MFNTNGTVTVNEALKKGKLHLSYIPIVSMFTLIGLYGLGIYLLSEENVEDNWLCAVFALGGIVAALLVPFVYYYYMLPRWRIWAFTNVRNVHELKQKALLARIMYEDDSFWMRFQIASAEQKEQLRQLIRKFEKPDEFVDDPSIPFETVYSYGKAAKAGLVFSMVFFALGIVAICFGEYLGGSIAAGVAIIISILIMRRYNKMKDTKLIFSAEGITSPDNDFHSWQQIQDEKVYVVGSGKNTTYHCSYSVSGKTIQIQLQEFAAPPNKVDHLLRIYRGRYEANKRK